MFILFSHLVLSDLYLCSVDVLCWPAISPVAEILRLKDTLQFHCSVINLPQNDALTNCLKITVTCFCLSVSENKLKDTHFAQYEAV